MKLLQIVHSLYPQSYGGVELFALEALRALGGTALTLTPISEQEANCPEWQGLNIMAPEPGESASGAIARAIDELKPEAVLIQHLGSASPEVLGSLIDTDIPYAVFLHDFTALCPTHRLWHRAEHDCSGPDSTGMKCAWCVAGTWRRAAEVPLRVLAYRHRPQDWHAVLEHADVIVANSRFLREFWTSQGIPADRIVVAPPLLPETDEQSQTTLMDSPAPRVLYAGGWSESKGAGLLAHALQGDFPPIVLDVVGRVDPESRVLMTDAVGPRHQVRFHGIESPQSMVDRIRSSSLVVIPSRCEETFSRIAAESQLEGVPVVATAVGGLPERIIHGLNGYLAVRDDSNSLAQAMLDCLAAKDWSPQLVQRNTRAEMDAGRSLLTRVVARLCGRESEPEESHAQASGVSRVNLNHAMAYFHAAGCHRICILDPTLTDAASWFQQWGFTVVGDKEVNSAEGLLAVAPVGEEETPETRRAYFRLRFPHARSLVVFGCNELETMELLDGPPA